MKSEIATVQDRVERAMRQLLLLQAALGRVFELEEGEQKTLAPVLDELCEDVKDELWWLSQAGLKVVRAQAPTNDEREVALAEKKAGRR